MQSNYLDGNRPINVKAQFGEDLRRIVIKNPSDFTWDYLSSRLSSAYGIPSEIMRVQYIDDEEDKITISSTEELNDAVSFFADKPCVRFSVSKISQNPSPIPAYELSRGNTATATNHSPKYGYKYADKNVWKEEKKRSKEEWKRKKQEEKKAAKEAWKKKKQEEKMMNKEKNLINKETFQTEMAMLISMGFAQKGFNAMLLKKYRSEENRVDKAVEMLSKNVTLQEEGFTKTGLNLRMLIKFNGNLEEVKMCLIEKEEKAKKNKELNEALDALREKGYPRRGINRMLLMKMDGDIEKVESILVSARALEEKGFHKLGLNVRLLMKHDGDVTAVEECLIGSDKYRLKHEKKQFKMEKKMMKQQYKLEKKLSKEFKKESKNHYKMEKKYSKEFKDFKD